MPVAQPETAPAAPVAASEPVKDAEPETSDPPQKVVEAEKPAAEPEKPSESAPAPDAQPVSTEASVAPAAAAPTETENKPPKPVSVEEVRDAEMPPAKPLEAEESAKAEDSTVKPAVPAPEEEEDKDVEMADAVPAATETEKPEPQAGDKRKAEEEVGDVNGAVAEEAPEADPPALKKQKSKGSASNGTEKKPGRPKKEKKVVAPIGKTARRTRSQAALDEA